MQITGQCHCGAVRFTAQVEPERAMVCHCVDCQQFSGAPLRAVIPVPVAQVQMQGVAKSYIKTAASGRQRAQAFCPECGTQLYATEADAPQTLNFRLGCINERAQLPPRKQVWAQDELAWVQGLNAIPAYERGMDSPLRAAPKP